MIELKTYKIYKTVFLFSTIPSSSGGINIKLLYGKKTCIRLLACFHPVNPSIMQFIYFSFSFSATTTTTFFVFSLKMEAFRSTAIFSIIASLLSLCCNYSGAITANPNAQQSQFLSLIRTSLSSGRNSLSLSDWNFNNGYATFCNFSGITCNDKGFVTGLDLTSKSLSGEFPTGICTYLPELRKLRLGHNSIHGSFIHGLTNCSLLEELNLTHLYLPGTVPDLSPMKSLRELDLSYNLFSGEFPVSFTNLTNLELVNFNENGEFNLWEIPHNISRLTRLTTLILCTCMAHGRIPPSIGTMTALVDLELAGNYLTGEIPPELGQLRNLRQLELYYNNLVGPIPSELGNLTELRDLDISVNQLSGKIPESICRLPALEALQLYNNSLTGEIPAAIGNSTTLHILSLYINYLTGEVPQNLGIYSGLTLLDLSENRLSGPLPPEICRGGKLIYLLLLKNMLSGPVPASYGNCSSIIRFRVSDNNLDGPIPEGILGLPHASIIDFSNNNVSGYISGVVAKARNLSELFLQNNRISGTLPPEISGAVNLVKIDLSNNAMSGPIPSEIGNLRKLNLLLLQKNKFNSSIPVSLSSLKSLNVLDVSDNRLTGNIPDSLVELLPNSINFSNNLLSGPIPNSLIKGGEAADSFAGNPGLCVSDYFHSSDSTFPICPQKYDKKKLNSFWAVGISAAIIILALVLYIKRRCSHERTLMDHEEMMSSSFFSYDVKSFHRISFDQREIIESMIDKNIVGHGGSGTVYKIELNSGEVIAVKKLWSKTTKDYDNLVLDKELKTEVETLGNIRHKNIVKLFCYFSSMDCSLLVYEYMPNGNLYDALHKGFVLLDWPTRHQIALGIAQGLAYLHNDLMPPIIHRDIKSTNILLDVNYKSKVADFGIAKVLQARGSKDSTTTVIAGTYGYLAPGESYTPIHVTWETSQSALILIFHSLIHF